MKVTPLYLKEHLKYHVPSPTENFPKEETGMVLDFSNTIPVSPLFPISVQNLNPHKERHSFPKQGPSDKLKFNINS